MQRPCVLRHQHPGCNPPFGHCLCSLDERGVDCQRHPPRVPKVISVSRAEHKDEKAEFVLAENAFDESSMGDSADEPEIAEEDVDAPEPIEEVQNPECDGDADPIGDPDFEAPMDEDQVCATGMLVHIRFGRVHLCGNGIVERPSVALYTVMHSS